MANPHKGEVSLQAGDTVYNLHYDIDRFCELEEFMDRGAVDVLSEMGSWSKDPTKVRMSLARTIFWIGLREHHPDINLKAAGELMVTVGGIVVVINAITEGIQRAFPMPETKDTRPQKRSRNGIGHHS